MHNAPSVSYPVGRCAFQRRCSLGLLLCALVVLGLWSYQQPFNVAMAWSGLCVVMAAVLGWASLQHIGTLSWNGQVWCLHDQSLGHEDALGEVCVALDVQKALLLRWQPASDTLKGKSQWLWLGSQASDQPWQDLRRAVYQRSDM